jgi:hypothetical protein
MNPTNLLRADCADESQFDISVNGYHLPTLAKVVREMGSPCDGPISTICWNIAVVAGYRSPAARAFLAACGYEATAAYPLKREA